MDQPAPPTRVSDKPPAPGPAPTAHEPVADEPTHSATLHHSRRPIASRGWLRVALPVAGLLVVPTFGLVYTATASFGEGDEAAAPDGSVVVEGGGKAPGAAKKKLPKGMKSPTKPRSDGAADCCAKLNELGRTATIDQRTAYLAAAQACDTATDEEAALKVAKSTVLGARQELPPECQP